jgi:thioredoxin-dependent peroxiredoxin
MSVLKVSDRVPDFTLLDQHGKPFTLSASLGQKVLVVYFYPKDETSGCTAEACAFRDAHEVFVGAGAAVIGISADSVESHKRFAEHRRLPFILLSDPNNHVRRLFGVPKSLFGFVAGRVTYVIDKQGVIRHVFESQIRATRHVEEALSVVRRLKA